MRSLFDKETGDAESSRDAELVCCQRAERIGYDGLHFVRRHLAMLPLAIGLMFAVSLQPPRIIRRIALIGFGISLVLLALTFVIGAEIKGARRWINFPGLSLQPSEFVKPTFAVVAAWLGWAWIGPALRPILFSPALLPPLIAAALALVGVVALLVRVRAEPAHRAV